MGFKYAYPEIQNWEVFRPTLRMFLGKNIDWTYKEDGSNIAIWLEEEKIHIASRHQEKASQDLVDLVLRTEEYQKIVELLKENPTFVVYVEACRKGRSVTGARLYERDQLFLFDICDSRSGEFLPYTNAYQHAYHHGIQTVKLYAQTRHKTIKDLRKFCCHLLDVEKAEGLEGMVGKAHYGIKDDYLQLKVKVDIPRPVIRKIAKGNPIYPEIPEAEILGAVDKAWQDLGNEKFKDVKTAMPLIAEYVKEECKKHLYSSPTKKLFAYYQDYLRGLVDV